MENPALRTLENSEILAVCKILLESRSMCRDEMFPILDKLIACCVPERNRKAVQELLANEKHHYIEPHHGHPVLNGMWELGQAIQNHQMVEIEYERLKEPRIDKTKGQTGGHHVLRILLLSHRVFGGQGEFLRTRMTCSQRSTASTASDPSGVGRALCSAL
jgi:hypothetical protein